MHRDEVQWWCSHYLRDSSRKIEFMISCWPQRWVWPRVQILGKEDLPSLNEAISLIRAEERRRGVMLDVQPLEDSAMVSASTNNGSVKVAAPEHGSGIEKGRANLSGATNKDNVWCTYCKKPRHTKDRCWKLYGKPQTSSKEWGFKGGQQPSTLH